MYSCRAERRQVRGWETGEGNVPVVLESDNENGVEVGLKIEVGNILMKNLREILVIA